MQISYALRSLDLCIKAFQCQKSYWLLQVYRGVRVGGLHMSVKHCQFKGQPHFPHDYPDCPAGVLFQSEQEAELIDKFKR